MSMRLLLLCPGQGGQHAGMNALAQGEPAAAAFLASAPAAPDATLFANRVAQPALVAATVAMWLALRPRLAALALRPALVAGYSVGELSAACVAGALAPDTALALAAQRAALMDGAAAGGGSQTLAALAGLPLALLEQLAAAQGFAIAIVNGEDSCVAGGLAAALPALQQQLLARGGRCTPLPVTVAAHTPLLAAAVAPFAHALAAAPRQPPIYPLLAGIDGSTISAGAPPALMVDALSRQLAETIRWSDCMDAAAESGITVALELGPGAALARMLQARHGRIACRSVAEFRSIDGIVGWLERQR